ncbi:hypothetical protein BDZ90DRAFT_71474 [Jaminaea rosea]|uniref:Uncharacterized protein n=1 Tax=Jaminaea rosea TaxID=1569628 RepID=A0A316UKC9_9BASI|nr:hypothetical protein BDZ90DRAFT_71474 [Jaminaea rosea]PWN25689.1 hypothetical protein BDZ90DRAFT_71474 [Jaminaea rosea]
MAIARDVRTSARATSRVLSADTKAWQSRRVGAGGAGGTLMGCVKGTLIPSACFLRSFTLAGSPLASVYLTSSFSGSKLCQVVPGLFLSMMRSTIQTLHSGVLPPGTARERREVRLGVLTTRRRSSTLTPRPSPEGLPPLYAGVAHLVPHANAQLAVLLAVGARADEGDLVRVLDAVDEVVLACVDCVERLHVCPSPLDPGQLLGEAVAGDDLGHLGDGRGRLSTPRPLLHDGLRVLV